MPDHANPDRKRLERLLARAAKAPRDPYLERFLGHRARRSKVVAAPDATDVAERVRITYLGEKTVDAPPMQTVLETSCANGIAHVSECGGRARCSTCRVIVVDGLENCMPRNTLEERLASRKGFYPEIRLACQTRVLGDVTLKRLVRDETDIEMALTGSLGDAGEEIMGAVLFTDLWGFTAFAESHLPYDVIHALNLLFNVPAVRRLELVLNARQVRQRGLVCVLGQRQTRGMVLLDQLRRVADAVGHNLEYAAVQLLRHCLRQTRDTHTLGDHAHAVIGLQFAGDQFQQGRFSLAIAPHQADTLTRLD